MIKKHFNKYYLLTEKVLRVINGLQTKLVALCH